MKCGVIYVKLVPKTHHLSFIKYCYMFKALPLKMQKDIEEIVQLINNKYKDYLIIPMVCGVHPGCVVLPEFTNLVASELYQIYDMMMRKYCDTPSVRCAGLIGDVIDPYNSNNIHTTHGDALIELGRFLDSTDDTGLYIKN